ncbi:SpoVR family protein [Halalkaliarchaeum sp. AArc-GB]|uniref:SpoVR family protein n=1 Tax=Halalkaliarchaeum sp. AArc-GB TaxID=3074078 RepID=UPI002855BA54|nr:SpoVR family protein [Halalkaliarchaeum sp. AArc-GB]MDR5672332.1 SpoVR family protein [Halalkaliarchaeum sp. AArc-GB]
MSNAYRDDRLLAKREATELLGPVREARNLARKLGLDPYPVNYWVVDHEEMNHLIAYDGFQRRYPHWRWGMKYDRQRKRDQHGLGKAFEIVNNDEPANAFLQESNSLADQKAVITHVEAHADFFRNNEWYRLYADRGEDGPAAAAMLSRHADAIEEYMEDPEIPRDDVEQFIDAVSCLEDTIDQYRPLSADSDRDSDSENSTSGDDPDGAEDGRREVSADLELSSEVREAVFDDEWLEGESKGTASEPRRDVLGFLLAYGKRYDEEERKAVDRPEWQTDVLSMLREEAYYFAPQKMTKVTNEGWASYWESLMMADEQFAGTDEFVTYADHMSRVLASPGLNPYKLGRALWEYVENRANRREVIERLLRVDGVTWRNFEDTVDLEYVRELLEPDETVANVGIESLDRLDPDDPRVDASALAAARRTRDGEIPPDDERAVDADRHPWKLLTYEGLAERHYSLVKPHNYGVLARVTRSQLERRARYLFDDERYRSVEEAIADVPYTAGWDRLFEVRESHNDVTFIDEFLTQEFVDEYDYFTYEYSRAAQEYRVASTDAADVKKKLLLRFTNFGKPTIVVYDGNFDNAGELLLGHQYNGVAIDDRQTRATLERVFQLWGRPVNLATIRVEYDDREIELARRRSREPEGTEIGVRIRYDGDGFEEHDLDDGLFDRLAANDVDYDTKPDDWLA